MARERLQGEALETHIEYWMRKLGGELPVLDLPLDFPHPAVPATAGARLAVALPSGMIKGLLAFNAGHDTTLFMTLFSAFLCLLQRYSGQSDILIGTPIANRTHAEVEGWRSYS